uniref:Uncharacterized protein n=1 Tax=Cafeteria roenbergensis TaxID=33653 RepID=A0A7S0JS11_CAFRO|mmetsp:Transcript_15869/g.60065  ORF Transcript_15869/g.60065 Transcript_15869/m.60065 type:complete len:152 (+) Transcript_15869:114-569(+)
MAASLPPRMPDESCSLDPNVPTRRRRAEPATPSARPASELLLLQVDPVPASSGRDGVTGASARPMPGSERAAWPGAGLCPAPSADSSRAVMWALPNPPPAAASLVAARAPATYEASAALLPGLCPAEPASIEAGDNDPADAGSDDGSAAGQ